MDILWGTSGVIVGFGSILLVALILNDDAAWVLGTSRCDERNDKPADTMSRLGSSMGICWAYGSIDYSALSTTSCGREDLDSVMGLRLAASPLLHDPSKSLVPWNRICTAD